MRQHKCYILLYSDITLSLWLPRVRDSLAQRRAQRYGAPPHPALAGSCEERGHYQLPRKISLAAELHSA